jgi:hypothetical protein
VQRLTRLSEKSNFGIFLEKRSLKTQELWTQMFMEAAAPITTYRLTDHAQMEMARRQIPAADVADVARVLATPEHMEMVRPGRVIYQARVVWGTPPATSLLRVFVDIDRQPPDVVTVYRTSKIPKYWKGTT